MGDSRTTGRKIAKEINDRILSDIEARTNWRELSKDDARKTAEWRERQRLKNALEKDIDPHTFAKQFLPPEQEAK